jgi:hypothetical protein
VPFERGAREIADWYLADPARQVTDEKLDALMDKLAADFAVITPESYASAQDRRDYMFPWFLSRGSGT